MVLEFSSGDVSVTLLREVMGIPLKIYVFFLKEFESLIRFVIIYVFKVTQKYRKRRGDNERTAR